MDFLTLFAIYVVVVVTCIILVCKYSGQQQTPFTILVNSVGKVSERNWRRCVLVVYSTHGGTVCDTSLQS